MTRIVTSGTPETASRKTSWYRRAALGVAFAATGLVSLGAAATPAQAYWYGYGPAPYAYYHPHYYGWYGYRPAYWGGGWGWHHGWRHGYYHHR